jgi:molybdate transport system substrate-binding protein
MPSLVCGAGYRSMPCLEGEPKRWLTSRWSRRRGYAGDAPRLIANVGRTGTWLALKIVNAGRLAVEVMNVRLLRVALPIAVLLTSPALSFAQVKVIISGGFAAAYREVLPEFERATGISVTTASGASQGNGPDTIGAMLRRGEPADVVIMNRGGLAELIAQGRIVAGTDLDLAQALVGMAVRAGRPKPDISTVDAFRQTLLRARRIAAPGSSTSTITEILSRLGISNEIEVRIPSRGTESVAMVARGDAELAIQPVSEILHMPGVELVGTIPTELQHPAVYAAAIVAGSKEAEASRRLIAFLSSDRATAAITLSGMEPSRRR